MNDSSKIKIDYYRQASKEISCDPRDYRTLPKPIKEFKEALMNVSDPQWIRGEPPKHVLIDKISPKQVKSELNLYARLEDHFQLSENDLVNINLLSINSERLCASVLFVSGYKAWNFVRSFSKDQYGFNWEVGIDQSARYFDRIKSEEESRKEDDKNKEEYRRDRIERRDRRDEIDDYREDYKKEYKNNRHNIKERRMSCSAFVPCLKIPFSCEMSLKFRLDKTILLSLFPLSRFPSFSGVEEGSSSWHVHFGREIDVIEADQMLQKDTFTWAGHKFYFEKWDLIKNDIPWDIPDHYNEPKKSRNFHVTENFEEFIPKPLKAFEEEGEYMNLPKFKKKQKIETCFDKKEQETEGEGDGEAAEYEGKDETGPIKMKIKRKPIKKFPFIPPPIIKPEHYTEKITESIGTTIISPGTIVSVDKIDSSEISIIEDVKVDVDIESPILNSGSARTEGFFQLEVSEKRRVKFNGILEAFSSSGGPSTSANSSSIGSNDSNSGRSSRAQNRRPLLQTASNATIDLFKVSPLQSTQKLVALRNSSIHSYGLVLMEAAEPGDLIIEYVGELARASLANIREWKYEREYRGDGIASSYLFRLDGIMVIDASHRGNLARFINHSCDPNCFAKTITLNGSKRIVLYARKSIRPGEEITYDYKFPTEKDPKKKVKCLCGSSSCRKYLN